MVELKIIIITCSGYLDELPQIAAVNSFYCRRLRQ